MPNTHTTLDSLFTGIADAIREKTGETGEIVADRFPLAITNIVTSKIPLNQFIPFAYFSINEPDTTKSRVGLSLFGNDNFWIDWGDGTVEQRTAIKGVCEHAYAYPGKYLVSVKTGGSVIANPGIVYSYAENLRFVLHNLWLGCISIANDAGFINFPDIKELAIPGTMEVCDPMRFTGCANLSTLIVEHTTPPPLFVQGLDDAHASLKIYVPAASVNAYKTATNWARYAAKIFPMD